MRLAFAEPALLTRPRMFSVSSSDRDRFAALRTHMVRTQLSDRGLRDARVLDAMGTVPRHEFVSGELREAAYEDHPLPIGCEQTISQPYIVALMLEHLTVQPSDRVLEVGTGSGYVTALLSVLSAEVYSVERHAELAMAAERRLGRLGYSNVAIKVGDGALGWPEHAPYDVIIVSAAAAQVPPTLFAQLSEGGRMIVPVGSAAHQELQLIRKVNGMSHIVCLEGCRFVPLVGGDH